MPRDEARASMVGPSPSPSGGVVDAATTHQTLLYILGAGVVFLFLLAFVSAMKGRDAGL